MSDKNWWKKLVKESVGDSETREHENYEDVILTNPDDTEVKTHTKIYVEVVEQEGEPAVVTVTPIKKPKPLMELSKVLYKPSPNKSNRKGDVEYIILHHTGPGSFNGIVEWLCNKDAKASAHYVVGKSKQIKQLVSTKKEAWHAGVAMFGNERINNHKSIGIEICNHGRLTRADDGKFYYEIGRTTKKYTGKIKPVWGEIEYLESGKIVSGHYVPYPEGQLDSLVELCKSLVSKYPAITRDNILAHYEVAYPEGRKNDPFGLDIEMIKDMIFG